MRRTNNDGRSGTQSRGHSSKNKSRKPMGVLRPGRLARLLALAAAPAAVALWANPSSGQTVTWDAPVNNPAVPNDGSGFWDVSNSLSNPDTNWSNGTADSDWVNGEVASIGDNGTAGTITIDDSSGSVSAAGINFNAVSSGVYVIAGLGTDSLILTGGGTINTASSAVSATISASIAGSTGMSLNGGGSLTLTGSNSFTGGLTINSGAVTVGTGGNLGSSTNNVYLGTPNAGNSNVNPTGSLTLAAGVTNTIGSLVCATNNTGSANTLTINSGATLNVDSSIPATGSNSLATTNGVFIVGASNLSAEITTTLTVSGAGTLSVDGTTNGNNSSFLVGLGNSNTSGNHMVPTLDMSTLANFTFVTGTGPIPNGGTTGGNEFDVGVGSGANATALLAINSSITAGTVDIGDDSINTPGLTGNGPNNASEANLLYLGTGVNTINTNSLIVGDGREQGSLIWNSTFALTGSLVLAGTTGPTSTTNIIVGLVNSGTAPSSKSTIDFTGGTGVANLHSVNVQAGTVIVGEMAEATGGKSTTSPGGTISFDTGTFSIANALDLAIATSGTSLDNITGIFTVGSGPSSTGVFTLGSLASPGSFQIANYTGGAATSAVGTFNVKGGTANVFANIINVSTAGTTNTTVALTGGTLNMEGYAIGPISAISNTGAVGTRNLTTITLPSGTATLENLGGTGINDAGVNMNGTGTLILDGNDTYSNGTIITSGTLQVGQASDTSAPITPFIASGASITNSSALAFGSSQTVTDAGVVSGSGTLNQVGMGTTILTGANNYGGVTNITKGTLQIGSGGTIGTLGTNAGTITVNGTLAFDHSDNAISLSNPIVGSGVIQQIGSGTSTLSGANTYVGGTIVSGGALVITNPTALGFGGINTKLPQGTTVNTASTLDLSGQTITQAITLNGGTLTNSSTTVATIGSGVLGVGFATITAPAFTGDAAVSFGGPGTGAAATAVLGLSSNSFTLNSGGTGYTGSSANPVVTITGGGGTGAAASAVSTGGVITAINITNPGTGYTSTPTITIAPPTTGTQATATGNATNFVLDGIQQTSAGSGYYTAPTATLTATGGAATLSTTAVSGVTLLTSGTIGGAGNITIVGAVTGGGALDKTGSDTLTLSAPNTYSGGTVVNAGTLLIDPTSTPATTSALPTGSVSVTGGLLQLAPGVSGGTGPAVATSVNVTSLSITGAGQFDVNNNHIIITYGATDQFSTIAGYIQSGYNGGHWNGPGIISTAAQTKTNGLSYGLGYADGADGKVSGLSSGQIEVAYTLLGDANLDGLVNAADFTILAANFNQPVTGWDQGDFNYDGLVNAADFTDLAANFNQSVSGAASAGDVAALDAFAVANGLSLPTFANVPEPVSGVVMVMAGLGMVRRRRSSHLANPKAARASAMKSSRTAN